MSLSQKIATFIAFIAAIVCMIPFFIPDLISIDLSCPAIAVFTICEVVVCWENHRKWSFLLIIGAIISMAFFVLDIMV